MLFAVVGAGLFFSVGLVLLMRHETAVMGRKETDSSWIGGRKPMGGSRPRTRG